jgi:hypothetical protein
MYPRVTGFGIDNDTGCIIADGETWERLFEFKSDLLSILQPTTMVSIIKQLAPPPSKYRVSAKDLVSGVVALAFEAAELAVGGWRIRFRRRFHPDCDTGESYIWVK